VRERVVTVEERCAALERNADPSGDTWDANVAAVVSDAGCNAGDAVRGLAERAAVGGVAAAMARVARGLSDAFLTFSFIFFQKILTFF
jgi:hypothetical protein